MPRATDRPRPTLRLLACVLRAPCSEATGGGPGPSDLDRELVARLEATPMARVGGLSPRSEVRLRNATPSVFCCFASLRGLDLNQRPLGHERGSFSPWWCCHEGHSGLRAHLLLFQPGTLRIRSPPVSPRASGIRVCMFPAEARGCRSGRLSRPPPGRPRSPAHLRRSGPAARWSTPVRIAKPGLGRGVGHRPRT
jgi:hypothetical protein